MTALSDYAKSLHLSSYFVTKQRDNGELFVSLADNTLEFLKEAIRVAHCNDLPCDWVYDECKAAVEGIEGAYLDEDDEHGYTDGRVDVYTKDLFQWASDMCLTDTWAQAEDEYRNIAGNTFVNLVDQIRSVQYFAIEFIARTLVNSIVDNMRTEEEEEKLQSP